MDKIAPYHDQTSRILGQMPRLTAESGLVNAGWTIWEQAAEIFES